MAPARSVLYDVPAMNVPLRFSLVAALGLAPEVLAQEPPPAQWLRLDPLPAEMKLTPRESFDGVPPRFVLLTDGSVFVGGRRDVLRGFLDKAEMQAISTRLDLAMKAHNKAGAAKTLVLGEGPALFRFSVLLGSPLQIVVMGKIPPPGGPAIAPMADLVRGLAGFRHASFKPYDAAQFTMFVREKSLPGGCRTARALPPLAQAVAAEIVVPEALTHGFPTGPDMAQVCEGPKRYTVVFQALIPGGRD